MAKLVEGKSIIVTGAGRGIGEGIARDLAFEGGRLAVADIDIAAAERTAKAIRDKGGEAVAVKVDVVDRASVRAMIQAAVRAYGRLDVMFNNAGISKAGQFLEATEDGLAAHHGHQRPRRADRHAGGGETDDRAEDRRQDHQHRFDRRQE